MVPPIQPLPPEVINIIAAGEVIDSLAAVVRELVENALDAGATRLRISLFPELWRVQVADNGQGMDLTNLRHCALPHSTSKIQQAADLWKITSLGFRGEALHSIAQLAELSILSRSHLEDVGWCLDYNNQGEVVGEDVAAIAIGTIVTVSNLFGNVPVRRKGLPSPQQQLKDIQGILYHLALCHPTIDWQVYQNERLWLRIYAGKSPQDILAQLLRRVQPSDLQTVRFPVATPNTEETATIELVIGLPDRASRQKADWVKVAVNGRFVRSQPLEQTLIAGFARTLPRDRAPISFLHLTLPPNQIDWNRHPAKTEIYLHNLEFWQEQTQIALDRALKISPADVGQTANNQRIGKLLKTAETQGSYTLNRQVTPQEKSAIGIMELRAVAQVNQTYIVTEHANGIWLIEQHIAHERVLFEQLEDAWKFVPLETPLILSNLQSKQVEQLQKIGVEIEEFGEQMWAVRNVPEMLSQRSDCQDALLELSWGGDLQTAQVATACRSAIRNGHPLTLPEMQTLVNDWQATRNPRTCPHGRPIFLPLEESSLSRFFRRHWVIGKSHGI
ncbi:MAG: DNA mismatch repair endonuclease MutL [Kamptonema sp. SIO4C4]|nr:DNA mismatch repair endonuclease MutL [Kamptonema sp. SIO4C4]